MDREGRLAAGSEVARTADQLRRAFEGGAWHGPSVREILGGMSAEAAVARPLGRAHTAWEIVLHVTTWLDAVRRRLEGEDARPTDLEDWPPVPEAPDAGAWAGAVAGLDHAYARLRDAIVRLEDADLDRTVTGQPYAVYVMVHGVIQHTLYHAGQLAILARAG